MKGPCRKWTCFSKASLLGLQAYTHLHEEGFVLWKLTYVPTWPMILYAVLVKPPVRRIPSLESAPDDHNSSPKYLSQLECKFNKTSINPYKRSCIQRAIGDPFRPSSLILPALQSRGSEHVLPRYFFTITSYGRSYPRSFPHRHR